MGDCLSVCPSVSLPVRLSNVPEPIEPDISGAKICDRSPENIDRHFWTA